MREPPRRRRSDDEPTGGGLPLFPLVLIVILAGLLLGGVLAHFFGGARPEPGASPGTVAVQPTELPTPQASLSATPEPSATTRPSAAAQPSATQTSKPTAGPTALSSEKPSPKPSRLPTAKPSATAMAVSTPAPAETAAPTSRPHTPEPSPVASSLGDGAAAVVRSYLAELARGDRDAAAGYLAQGKPNETFMDAGAHVNSIRSSSVGGGRYQVSADVQTSTGEFYEVFVLTNGPSGLQITSHYAVKSQ